MGISAQNCGLTQLMPPIRQCAILVGGRGTRLGVLTADTPKPLLPCGDRPFLAWILRELTRFGIEDVLLLAGYQSDSVASFCRDMKPLLPRPLSIHISVEPSPAGTGGALWHARNQLDENFLLLNGDSWFDTNLARFLAAQQDGAAASILLRSMPDCSRYGTVDLRGSSIAGFHEKAAQSSNGLISTGIYACTRRLLDHIQPACSLEQDVFPRLAQAGLLAGSVLDGYFIDIGIPEDYRRAQHEIPQRLRRPAVFFDRDGVLNHDLGWVGTRDRFQWTPGAIDAIRHTNDLGFHAFIVTNQAGVAKGLFTEQDVQTLHAELVAEVHQAGATVDDIRYCPHHPDAEIAAYRQSSPWRKPAPGMILDLARAWHIDKERSLLIGDKPSDLAAASAAGIRGVLYQGSNLQDFLKSHLTPVPLSQPT